MLESNSELVIVVDMSLTLTRCSTYYTSISSDT